MGKSFREVAKERFFGNVDSLLRMVKANSKGLDNDQLTNGKAQVDAMAKLVKTLEAEAKKKTMTEQFTKFETEWKNAMKGKGMGKITHYLEKMKKTDIGEPDAPPPAEPTNAPKAPARPSTPAPSSGPKAPARPSTPAPKKDQ